MELIRQPNPWSCNACAWAMAMGISLEDVIAAVGHDGSRIWDRALQEPVNRVGFHDLELLWVAYRQGFFCMPFTFRPAKYRSGAYAEHLRLGSRHDLGVLLPGKRGVLGVNMGKEHDHAVAWDGEWAYDPLYGIKMLSDYPTILNFTWVAKLVMVPSYLANQASGMGGAA